MTPRYPSVSSAIRAQMHQRMNYNRYVIPMSPIATHTECITANTVATRPTQR